MRITVKGLDEDIVHFEHAGQEMPQEAKDAVGTALRHIKEGWRKEWNGKFDHAPRIDKSITYETKTSGFVVSGEVGPEDDPITQGYLGRILEFGGLHSGPHPGGLPAVLVEEPIFEANVAEVMRRLIG